MSGGEFAAIEARVAAATEGPWMVDGDDPTVVMKPDKPPSTWDGLLVARTRGGTGADIDSLPEYADAEFIAHSRTDIPALLAAVRERDDTIGKVRDVLQRLHDRIVFSSKDFGEDRFDIGLYGVIVGWDADEDDRTIEGHVDAWAEIQQHNPKFTDAVIAAIRADHAVIRAALDPQETP